MMNGGAYDVPPMAINSATFDQVFAMLQRAAADDQPTQQSLFGAVVYDTDQQYLWAEMEQSSN